MLFDAIVPGLAVAQAIGRWGNYFNQELYGRPTKLPWGLEIDLAHAPAGIPGRSRPFNRRSSTSRCGACSSRAQSSGPSATEGSAAGRRSRLYVSLYTFGRIFFEALRVDPASEVFGIRFNLLLSAAMCIGGAIWFVWLGRHRPMAVSARAAQPRTSDQSPPDSRRPPSAPDAGAV